MQVFVFACSHAGQVKQHVESSKWGSQKAVDVKVHTLLRSRIYLQSAPVSRCRASYGPSPELAPVQVIVGTACRSAGDALRAVDQSGVIGSDFVLVSGDCVSNLPLGKIVAEHRVRRESDPNAIMTMVRRLCCLLVHWQSGPRLADSPPSHSAQTCVAHSAGTEANGVCECR